MSKITFRADDALVEQLDALDASKSEVMREALREFLDRHPEVGGEREVGTTTEADGNGRPAATVDGGQPGTSPELTVNINLDGGEATVDGEAATVDVDGNREGRTESDTEADEQSCKQCGETVSADHSFCPNCGEEHRRPPRCECGEEIRSDWAFCPGCGRRSSASDVFDRA